MPRLASFVLLALATSAAPAADLSAFPPAVTLGGPDARQRLVVTETVAGKPLDRTREATYATDTPKVVAIGPDGVLTPVGDGKATVTATAGGKTTEVRVTVSGAGRSAP